MKIKLNIGVVFLANLLMGCASQLTSHGDAIAQEASSSETTIHGKQAQMSFKSTHFVSRAQEHMYKAMVAEIARLRGNHTLAADYFFEVAILTREPELAERATQAAWYAKNYYLAMKAARLWADIAPNNPNAQQFLVNALLRQKMPAEDAVVYLEAMLDNLKDDPQLRDVTMEAMLEQQKDQNLALALMEKLVAKRPNDPTVL